MVERRKVIPPGQQLPPEVGEQIGPYYVYALIDPRDGYDREIFYVGKGTGGRLLSHGLEAMLEYEAGTEPDKIARIKAIRAAGEQPQIDVIRHGLKEPDALRIEAAVIDTLEVENLTNKVRGHGTDKGRTALDDLISLYGAPPVGESAPPALLIVLGDWTDSVGEIEPGYLSEGYGYKARLTPTQIADATRAWWKVSPDVVEQKGIRHAVAVHAGVTRAVMEIGEWIGPNEDDRWAFKAELITEGPVYDEWVGTRGRKIDFDAPPQNPIRYWPFEERAAKRKAGGSPRRPSSDVLGRVKSWVLKNSSGLPEVEKSAPPALLILLGAWEESEGELEPGYFRKGHGYKPGLTVLEIVDSARGWWPPRNKATLESLGVQHAVAIHKRETKAVMTIDEWLPPRPGGREAFLATPVEEGEVFESWVGDTGKWIPLKRGTQGLVYWPLPADR